MQRQIDNIAKQMAPFRDSFSEALVTAGRQVEQLRDLTASLQPYSLASGLSTDQIFNQALLSTLDSQAMSDFWQNQRAQFDQVRTALGQASLPDSAFSRSLEWIREQVTPAPAQTEILAQIASELDLAQQATKNFISRSRLGQPALDETTGLLALAAKAAQQLAGSNFEFLDNAVTVGSEAIFQESLLEFLNSARETSPEDDPASSQSDDNGTTLADIRRQLHELTALVESRMDPSEAISRATNRADLVESRMDPRKTAPRLVALLVWLKIIMPLLMSIAGNYLYDGLTKPDRKQLIREATSRVSKRVAAVTVEGQPAKILRPYRLVTAPTLHVRANPTRRSEIVGYLRLTDVVRLVKPAKGNSWSLVEWCSSDSELVIRGWVFSRYLERIQLPAPVRQLTR